MRKRSDTKIKIDRPTGAITNEELDGIRRAYADGCRGDILIGLRGEERVITMLSPAHPNSIGSSSVPEEILKELRALGCDRCQRITSRQK